jgi:hypothetical protein
MMCGFVVNSDVDSGVVVAAVVAMCCGLKVAHQLSKVTLLLHLKYSSLTSLSLSFSFQLSISSPLSLSLSPFFFPSSFSFKYT